MMIWPLAPILPAICDGLEPTTRFSVTALDDGWLNCTLCWLPTLKPCQLIAPRWVDWLIVVWLAVLLIEALPPTTTPPVGRALGAGWAAAGRETTIVTVAHSAVLTSSAGRRRRTTPSSFTFAFRNGLAIVFTPGRPYRLYRGRRDVLCSVPIRIGLQSQPCLSPDRSSVPAVPQSRSIVSRGQS